MKNFTLISVFLFTMFGTITAQQEKGIIGYNNWRGATRTGFEEC